MSNKSATTTTEPQQVFNLLPLRWKHSRQNVSIQDAADALGLGATQVRELVDSGELGAASVNSMCVPVQREHVRILRFTVEAWWLEQWLAKRGAEYPVANSTEILWWRSELRKHRAGKPSFIQPSETIAPLADEKPPSEN